MEIPNDGLTDDEIREIYRKYRRVAVIGMSRNPEKPAHYVPKFLMEKGFDIIPVNPVADEILGKKVYKSLEEVPGDIDIVDVFRPSHEIPRIVDEAIRKNVKVIWLQEGIYHPVIERAREVGVLTVWNRCMMREYKRLFEK